MINTRSYGKIFETTKEVFASMRIPFFTVVLFYSLADFQVKMAEDVVQYPHPISHQGSQSEMWFWHANPTISHSTASLCKSFWLFLAAFLVDELPSERQQSPMAVCLCQLFLAHWSEVFLGCSLLGLLRFPGQFVEEWRGMSFSNTVIQSLVGLIPLTTWI